MGHRRGSKGCESYRSAPDGFYQVDVSLRGGSWSKRTRKGPLFVCPVHAFRMTVRARDRVDVVPALRIRERSVHLLHIAIAIRESWMTRGTGSRRVLTVLLMAGETAQPFVDPERSSVVARPCLPRRERC